jgi:hypothetical protein
MESYMGIGSSPRYGVHIVEVSLQYEDYRGTIIFELGGNCAGGSILSSVLSSLEDGDYEPNMKYEQNKKHIEIDEEDYVRHYILSKDEDLEDELLFDGNDIEGNIVGVKIIGWEKE